MFLRLTRALPKERDGDAAIVIDADCGLIHLCGDAGQLRGNPLLLAQIVGCSDHGIA